MTNDIYNQNERKSKTMFDDMIIKVGKSGCANAMIFNPDLQFVAGVNDIINVAEKHGFGMAQCADGYVEVWVDDDKRYRCEAMLFSSMKKGITTECIAVKNEESLLIGSKSEAESWLKHLMRKPQSK